MRDTLTPVVPVVGMGVTYCVGSDSYPYTVIEVSKSGKRVRVQQDTATRVDSNGQSEAQTWLYESDPDGKVMEFSLRKTGVWRPKGSDHCYLSLGGRRKYSDPSF